MQPVTVTITEDGNQLFVAGHGNDVFCDAGTSTVQRASHVEPDNAVLRWLFHYIRQRCADTSALAGFTRLWPCLWRINTAPVGGPILEAKYRDRKQAIEAEVRFLNQFFLGEISI